MTDELLQALKDITRVAHTRTFIAGLPEERPEVVLRFIVYIGAETIKRHWESQEDGTAD